MDIEGIEPGNKPSQQTVTILAIVSVFVLLIALGSYAWAYQYHDRIGPNVSISGINISGMRRDQAQTALQDRVDQLFATGLSVSTNTNAPTKTLSLSTSVGSDLSENVDFAINQTIDRAFERSHETNPVTDTYRVLTNTFVHSQDTIPVQINQERVKEEIYHLFPEEETRSEDPTFSFTIQNGTWTGSIIDGRSGTEFAFEPFFESLQTRLSRLDTSPLTIQLVSRIPALTNSQAQTQIQQALTLINGAPLTFTKTNETTNEVRTWTMTPQQLAEALKPAPGHVDLNQDIFNVFLDTIAKEIEQPAQDARIQIENGRVVDFIQSKKGIRLDRDVIYQVAQSSLASIDTATRSPIELTTIGEEPTVETGDVNDLGITDVLGMGTSSYKGSPKNRRANIQNGVSLLNGTLIAPGTTFSLVQALQPFTLENGYLPELVIKGDKIQPEIAGGLCQIGTTTFRAVMNSGLTINERQNHSLVVSYYNDPSNNNPGTDATLYEPAPDFKFTNDTEHYILLQAENQTETQQLQFTFWGTSDGRKGSYTPPVVTRWIPAGEKRVTETTDIEPGKEQCQAKHNGADTTFDYTVVNADGTTQVTTFTSHYRPLPEICLVGVEKLPEPTESLPDEPVSSAEAPVIPTTSLNN